MLTAGTRVRRCCTRTEITAGFTFSTMSAKPIGCGKLARLLGQILRMRDAGKAGLRKIARRGDENGGAEAGDAGEERQTATWQERAIWEREYRSGS